MHVTFVEESRVKNYRSFTFIMQTNAESSGSQLRGWIWELGLSREPRLRTVSSLMNTTAEDDTTSTSAGGREDTRRPGPFLSVTSFLRILAAPTVVDLGGGWGTVPSGLPETGGTLRKQNT